MSVCAIWAVAAALSAMAQAALVYVGLTRGRDINVAHVVIDEPGDEPGHLPAARGGPVEVLARALANEGPATATAVAGLEAAQGNDPAILAARYLAAADEDRRARLARAADAVGSTVLAGDDAWRVLDAAARLEAVGGNPARLIADLGPEVTVEGAVTAFADLRRIEIRRTRRARPEPLLAGVLPAITSHADPAVALWATETAERLVARRPATPSSLAATSPPKPPPPPGSSASNPNRASPPTSTPIPTSTSTPSATTPLSVTPPATTVTATTTSASGCEERPVPYRERRGPLLVASPPAPAGYDRFGGRCEVAMNPLELISADPGICHGQACIGGTRIPVSVILDCLAAGMNEADILAGYPTLSVEGIRAAAAYGAALAREDLVVLSER